MFVVLGEIFIVFPAKNLSFFHLKFEVSVEILEIVDNLVFGIPFNSGKVLELLNPEITMGDKFVFLLDFFGCFFDPIQLNNSGDYFVQELLRVLHFLHDINFFLMHC